MWVETILSFHFRLFRFYPHEDETKVSTRERWKPDNAFVISLVFINHNYFTQILVVFNPAEPLMQQHVFVLSKGKEIHFHLHETSRKWAFCHGYFVMDCNESCPLFTFSSTFVQYVRPFTPARYAERNINNLRSPCLPWLSDIQHGVFPSISLVRRDDSANGNRTWSTLH